MMQVLQHRRKAFRSAGGSAIPDLLWWKVQDSTILTGDATNGGDDGTHNADRVVEGSGFALDFNGSDDAASTDAPINYGGANKITVTFWCSPDDTTALRVLAESSANYNGVAGAWIVYFNGGDLVASMMDAGALAQTDHVAAPATGAWVHIAVVFDFTNTGTIKIYLDGASQSLTNDNPSFATATTASTNVLYVGARGLSSLFLDGKFDDVRLYSTELSAGDITAIKNEHQ